MRKKVIWVALGLALTPSVAFAGLLSDLGNLANSAVSQIQSQIQMVENQIGGFGQGIYGMLDVGKVINTGQNQQLSANLQERNQVLQEGVQSKKEIDAAGIESNYLVQTQSGAQPLGCTSAQMGAANLQSSNAQNAQEDGNIDSAVNGFVPGTSWELPQAGQQQPSNWNQIENLAAYSGNQSNASALFDSQNSSNQATVEQELLDPIPPQVISEQQAQTAAGEQYSALWNIYSGQLSVAAAGIGLVASMHTFVVPGSAVQNAASAQGISTSVASAATDKPVPSEPSATASGSSASSSSASSSSASSSSASSSPAASSTSSSGSSDAWKKLAGPYANEIAKAAAEYNIPPAMMAAQMNNESTGDLQALATCGSLHAPDAKQKPIPGSPNDIQCYIPGGYTVKLPNGTKVTYYWQSAKSLFQMIDLTAQANGLNNPMLGTTDADAEIQAAARGYARYSDCKNSADVYACYWSAWAVGSITMVNGKPSYASSWSGYINKATNALENAGASVPDGPIPGYSGGSGGYDSGSGSSSANASSWLGGSEGASTAGLLRMTSYGSYANPAWITKLNALPVAGVWRVIAYLQAMQNVVENNNRKLMERYVAIVAERNSLPLQQKQNQMNSLRGRAMEQYAREPLLTKIANDL